MEVALVIGHTKFRKGAYSKWLKQSEHPFYKQYEDEFKTLGDVFYHNPYTYSYTKRQKAMAEKTKYYDLVLEIHFNSSNGKASGCEALYYYKNTKTREIASEFCKEYSKLCNSRNRGAKPLLPIINLDTGKMARNQERGFGFVYHQKPAAIILEPFFGDNLIDVQKFEIKSFIEAIRRSLP